MLLLLLVLLRLPEGMPAAAATLEITGVVFSLHCVDVVVVVVNVCAAKDGAINAAATELVLYIMKQKQGK